MMRDDFMMSNPRAMSRPVIKRRDGDRDYHRERAMHERAAADRTQDHAARMIHLQLAELHEAAGGLEPAGSDRGA